MFFPLLGLGALRLHLPASEIHILLHNVSIQITSVATVTNSKRKMVPVLWFFSLSPPHCILRGKFRLSSYVSNWFVASLLVCLREIRLGLDDGPRASCCDGE